MNFKKLNGIFGTVLQSPILYNVFSYLHKLKALINETGSGWSLALAAQCQIGGRIHIQNISANDNQ
ncbi:MAG: hypothetical protein PUB26_01945 [Mycoplasmataceae bacterium]|nr:hypothetical protein [Mycoplasmataceae bacterium]